MPNVLLRVASSDLVRVNKRVASNAVDDSSDGSCWYVTRPAELGVHHPSAKRKFLRRAAQGDRLGTSYVSAVDVPHCVVETAVDREGQEMVMRVLKLLVLVPTKLLFFYCAYVLC